MKFEDIRKYETINGKLIKLSKIEKWENKFKELKESLSFNVNDLDKLILNERIDTNTNMIYLSEKARKGRTREQVKNAVSIGIPCEVHLIQNFNGEINEEKYGDVIVDGIKIECKASTFNWTEESMNKMIDKIKHYSPSKIIMFWKKDKDNYEFQGFKHIK